MPAYPFSLPSLNSTAPSYENIIKTLSTQTPNESDFLPEIEQILSQRSQFLQPAINELQHNIGMGMADLEGTFARRGLTGSSIEAQGLATAAGRGNQAVAGLVGDFAQEGAGMFAQLLSRARAGDVAASRQIQQLIAQAMGEELTAQRDMDMFNRSMDFQASQASRNRRQQLINSLIGLGGQAGSAAITGGMR